MSAFLGEFIGTAILVLLGNGVVANVLLNDTKGRGAGWIAIALGWGMAVFAGALIATAASGAHINPAVTIGLAVQGTFEWSRVPMWCGCTTSRTSIARKIGMRSWPRSAPDRRSAIPP
jgi:glycerol uptake facilitator protein